MTKPVPMHLHFLRRAQRRWALWRSIEWAGIAAAVGAGAGLILVGMLAWRGESGLGAAIVLPLIGSALGLVWGFHRRPTLTQTAILTDRQLGLHDLLSTALLAGKSADQAFAETVFAQAHTVCIDRSPNELIVRRLDARAWSGIGILSALVLTIALMSNEAGVRVAQAQTETQSAPLRWISPARNNVVKPTRSAESIAGESQIKQRAILTERDAGDGGELAGDREDSSQSSDASRSKGPSDTRSIKVDAIGESEGQTANAQVPMIPQLANAAASDTTSSGTLAAGGSATPPSKAETQTLPQSPDNRAGAETMVEVPSWNVARPPPKSDDNGSSLSGNPAPDRYRDLIQDYFSRQR